MEDMFTEQELGQFKGVVGDSITVAFEEYKEVVKDIVTESIGEALEQIVLPRFDKIETRLDIIESELGTVKSELGTVKSDVGIIKATMVTRDDLDRRLVDFKQELHNTGEKALRKITRLTQILHSNSVMSVAQVVEVGKV